MAFKNYSQKQEDVISPYLTHKQAQKIRDKRRHKELLREVSLAGRSDRVKEAERILISNPTSRNAYVFTNPVTKAQQTFHGVEYSEYTAYQNQPIIHGVITISEFDESGKKIGEKSEDIYMYQPRFEGRDRFLVGPRYRSDGTLNNRATYAYRDPDIDVIYIGNIPKREIVSNRQFDFDASNKENFKATKNALGVNHRKVEEIVSIKYDTDPQTGYIKTVNMNNSQEKARYDAYIRKYSTGALAEDMIESYTHRIEKAVQIFEKISDKIEESVARVGLAENYQAEKTAEASQTASSSSQPKSVAEENAQMVNDVLKYGIRPSLASPIDDGIGGLEISRPTPPPAPGGRGRR